MSVTMRDLWSLMMERNHWSKPGPRVRAHARLGKPLKCGKIDWRKGRLVNVVMASRFGDVGLTDNLDAFHGYDVRVQCVDWYGEDGSTRLAEPDMLTDIEVRYVKEPEPEPTWAQRTGFRILEPDEVL